MIGQIICLTVGILAVVAGCILKRHAEAIRYRDNRFIPSKKSIDVSNASKVFLVLGMSTIVCMVVCILDAVIGQGVIN